MLKIFKNQQNTQTNSKRRLPYFEDCLFEASGGASALFKKGAFGAAVAGPGETKKKNKNARWPTWVLALFRLRRWTRWSRPRQRTESHVNGLATGWQGGGNSAVRSRPDCHPRGFPLSANYRPIATPIRLICGAGCAPIRNDPSLASYSLRQPGGLSLEKLRTA